MEPPAPTVALTMIDKTPWPPGPWQDEPDWVQWTDPGTRYHCLLARNAKYGHWAAYVGVPPGHFAFMQPADRVPVAAHGGIEFAADAPPTAVPKSRLPAAWWIGFNAMHAWDVLPDDPRGIDGLPGEEAAYRDVTYMTDHCRRLAAQLAALPAFCCPKCLKVSQNPDDAREGYCGACHAFTRRRFPGNDT